MGDFIKKLKYNLTDNSLQSLIWLINLVPSILGFSYFKNKVGVSFLIFVTMIAMYIVLIGTIMYQIRYTTGYLDKVKTFLNVLIFADICNSSRWMCFERKGLKTVLKLFRRNNGMPMQFERSAERRKKILKHLKYIVLICYALHIINEVIVFGPKWLAEPEYFSLVPCVGLETMTNSPDKKICKVFFFTQLLGAVTVTACYDSTFLFLFGYTAATFETLKEEILSLNIKEEDIELQEVAETVGTRLKNIIIRHILTLNVVDNIQDMYNFSIGSSFVEDALTMCLFFIVPLRVSLNFVPLLIHNFLIFFFYCYQGQKITTAAERFEMAVYCCGWENFNVNEQKMVLTVLRQSQKPVIINAASVVPICIYTFACTLQGIYKFGAAFKS